MNIKPRLLPVSLDDTPSETFVRQLGKLRELTRDLVDWLEPAHIDRPVPKARAPSWCRT